MTPDSFEKAGSFKTLAASLPSLHFWQGYSLGVSLNSAISFSSCFGARTPWSKEWHWWFDAPINGDGVPNCTWGWRLLASAPPVYHSSQLGSSLHPQEGQLAAHCQSGSCSGYRCVPQFSGEHAPKTTPKASMKAWWANLSSSVTWCSMH